jgi:hypothetical protein
MRWRQVTDEDVVGCINEQDARRETAIETNSWKSFRGRWLRVVHVEEGDALVVVSVIFPAREPRDAS